jgi:dTDP-4-amino-4,6-dideoxygalactose transaminase
VLIPSGTNLRLMGYEKGSCPRAEKAAQETLNLPTHINIRKKDAEEIVKFLLSA